jgi:hypothetical protein
VRYLSVLDDTAFGAATPVRPKFVSTADPASRWTGDSSRLSATARALSWASIAGDKFGVVSGRPAVMRGATCRDFAKEMSAQQPQNFG